MHRNADRLSSAPIQRLTALMTLMGILALPAGGMANDIRLSDRATIRVVARVVTLSGGEAVKEATALVDELDDLTREEDLEKLEAVTAAAASGRYMENGLIRLSLINATANESTAVSPGAADTDGSPRPLPTGGRTRQILIEFVGI
jgi:hypothetical protein